MISTNKKNEFHHLFKEFVESYLSGLESLKYQSNYKKERKQGKSNFQLIQSLFESGEDITEKVLLLLLPYQDSQENREKGAWIHHAYCIKDDFETWCKNLGLPYSPKIAQEIFNFINSCYQQPENIAKVAGKLKEFPSALISPILNALSPNDFLLINSNSRKVFNYLAETNYSDKIKDYHMLNTLEKVLVYNEFILFRQYQLPAISDYDIFDMFIYWLIKVKKYQPNESNKTQINPEYTLEKCSLDTGIDLETLNFWLTAINRTKQVIFYGPPGTGKTYIAKKLAQYLVSNNTGIIDFIQFHPAYSYEDFIQGIRPQSVNGQLTYPLIKGRFLEFCAQVNNSQDISVLIIDEINRANIAHVFGELMYLLEYRNEEITLASGDNFTIPNNVIIIGTMNTADRSIALVDHALRRRFAFISLTPNYNILRSFHQKRNLNIDSLITILDKLNQTINNPHYEVGISFFLRPNLYEELESIWRLEIEPYLEEYFFDQWTIINEFRWEKIKQKINL